MVGKKYSADFKRKMVEEYLNLRTSNPNISKADFAYQKWIADSTFNDWVIKYERQGFSNQQASFTVKVNDYGYKYLTITVFSQDGTNVSKKISIYDIYLADNIYVTTNLKCKTYMELNYYVKVKSYSIDVIPISNTSAKIQLSISREISINSGLQMSVYFGSTLIGTMRQQSITSSNLVLTYTVSQAGSYNLSFDKLLYSPIF